MGKITITSAVIFAFSATIHNGDTNRMEVNWNRNTEILHDEKHATPKIVEVPMVNTVEEVTIILDYRRQSSRLKLSGLQSDHHQPQIRKIQHRLQILKQQIDQLKCHNKSSTLEHNSRTKRSTFVSSFFSIATEGDLNMAKNEIKITYDDIPAIAQNGLHKRP